MFISYFKSFIHFVSIIILYNFFCFNFAHAIPNVYNYNEYSLGLKYCTNGYGLYIQSNNLFNQSNKYINLEFNEYIHHKEYKIINESTLFTSSSFKYGKIYSNYFIKFGIGHNENVINFDNFINAINIYFYFGINVNIRKNYGLYYYNQNFPKNIEKILYDNNKVKFHDKSNIIGAQEWWKNWESVYFNPGFFFSIKLNLDLNRKPKFISNKFFIGAEASYFNKSIIQLMDIKNRNIIWNCYLGYEFSLLNFRESHFKSKR